MTRTVLLILLALLPVGAQQPGNASAPTQPQSAAGAGDTAGKKSVPEAALVSEQYSDAAANLLLSRIAEGFARRNSKLLLSAFDPQRFEGYPLFADRMRARLGQNDSFRAYFRIADTTLQDARATVTVELQIEQSSTAEAGRPPLRSTGQVRFTIQRGAAGWRIVELSPRYMLTGVRGPA